MAGSKEAQEAIRAAIRQAGSQRAVAEQLGIHKSMVGRMARGERSADRWESAARDLAAGKPVTPPGRARRVVRQPIRSTTSRGGRVQMGKRAARGPTLAREARRSRRLGNIRNLAVRIDTRREFDTESDAARAGTPWSGMVFIADPTQDQLDLIDQGDLVGAIRLDPNYEHWVGEDTEILDRVGWDY